MHTEHHTPFSPVTARPASRRVTDAPTRMFHWLLALCFMGAYVSAGQEPWQALHEALGYSVLGLLLFRLLYGFWGPPQSRWTALWGKVRPLPGWMRAVWGAWRGRLGQPPNWVQGQNMAGALITVLMLAVAVSVLISGISQVQSLESEWLESVHELLGQVWLGLVLLHLVWLLGISLLRRKNAARPMLSGRQSGPGPDLVKNKRVGLALLLLVALLAYWGWEWSHGTGLHLQQATVAEQDEADQDEIEP